MTTFDQLHPAIQHHIVNTLGWRQLRPLQSEAIPPVLQGQHALLLAPTAGGKTEAAVLPLMSRMTSENWSGLSLVYLCPIKALLNNLHVRLSSYMQLMGRTAAVWHGDVTTAERKRLLRDPPDCLLTTPESLELMLVSSTTDERTLFGRLRAVVVDEIHAFAGDDRGWHLLCVLSRLSHLSPGPIQRIGLSATVGNPLELLEWFASRCPGERVVVNPSASAPSRVEITVDFVGSVENAAFVVSQLHRGEKRLVFCDSRSRAEQMASRLRNLGITTFVSHSSLSVDERRQAESAFASGNNCVIVATSTLELGIDVGDLDRVIQLDAPTTVRSFLQRLGRTGRRDGTARNCLFLATSKEALLNATGLVELWRAGYVEPTEPPPLPFHVLCQQLMALALQERGIARNSWFNWLSQAADLALTSLEVVDALVNELLRQDILWEEAGVLWFGRCGEKELGYRAFSELLSVFTTEPLLTAMHGPMEIGHLHPLSLASPAGQPRVVSLGGRSWTIRNIDWKRRTVSVEPSSEVGRSLWKGRGPALSSRLCEAIRDVLTAEDLPPEWSRRATDEVIRLRGEYGFLSRAGTCLQIQQNGESIWWTFAGLRANDQLAAAFQNRSGLMSRASNLLIEIDGIPDDGVMAGLVSARDDLRVSEAAIDAASNDIKFADYLPADLRLRMLSARLSDHRSVQRVLSSAPRWITNAIS